MPTAASTRSAWSVPREPFPQPARAAHPGGLAAVYRRELLRLAELLEDVGR
jgi:hypothetical protein